MRLAVAVLAASLLAACGDKPPQPRVDSRPAASGATATAAKPATKEERREGANPVQGQVDPKQREQHNDFRQRGDKAGPTSPDTQPGN